MNDMDIIYLTPKNKTKVVPTSIGWTIGRIYSLNPKNIETLAKYMKCARGKFLIWLIQSTLSPLNNAIGKIMNKNKLILNNHFQIPDT